MIRRTLTIAAGALLMLALGKSRADAAVGLDLHGKILSDREVRQVIVAAPRVHYPRLSRLLRSHGIGLYEMRIDPATGKVNEVAILRSTGARILDLECIRAFSHWRFKPGTVRLVRESVDFRLSWRANTPEESF